MNTRPLFGAPFELAVLAFVVLAVRRASRRLAEAGIQLDIPERLHAVLAPAVPPRIAGILVTELSTFYFALAAWRKRPFVPPGARAFSYHRNNGFAALLYTVVFLSAVEVTAVDLVLRVHFARTANVLLALGAFGAVWLLGFARSVQLRPILVHDGQLLVRTGILWELNVPLTAIRSIGTGRVGTFPTGAPQTMRFANGTPNALVVLEEPAVAQGPYGTRRLVGRFTLSLDDVSGFASAVAASKM